MSATSRAGWTGNCLAACLVLLLAACSSTVVRAPDAGGGREPAASSGRAGATVVVQQGDTLYSISRRSGASVDDLVRWNGLKPP